MAPKGEPCTYKMAFQTAGGPRNCPVVRCCWRAATWTPMRFHFFHRYVRDNVIILEEGNLPHPRFPRCDMLVPWWALNGRHLATNQCTKGRERNLGRMEEEDMWDSAERGLWAYIIPLDMVTLFKYLGRVLTAEDDDCTAKVGNWKRRGRVERIWQGSWDRRGTTRGYTGCYSRR